MKFTKVRFWTWKHFFSGQMCIQTKLDATEEQVQEYINHNTSTGGSGNWDLNSLTTEVKSIKASKANITNLNK